jgi:hypothetical protein
MASKRPWTSLGGCERSRFDGEIVSSTTCGDYDDVGHAPNRPPRPTAVVFLLSFSIHAGLLWQCRSVPLNQLKPFSLTTIGIVPYSASLSSSDTEGPKTCRAAARRLRLPPAYEGEVYAEADFNAFFTPDLRTTVNVPANEVCLDADILRTHERRILSQRVTDISKCRFESYGDEQERMRCPPEAHTVLITHDSYLSSPLRYSVNMCTAYDRSSCYISPRDDGPDQEICRVRGKYDGVWAAGTMFHYPCATFSSQIFSHSLQYEVRFLQHVEFPDAGMRRRLVRREKRSVTPCE